MQRLNPLLSGALRGIQSKSNLPALTTILDKCEWVIILTKSLAYYDMAIFTVVKSFVEQATKNTWEIIEKKISCKTGQTKLELELELELS